MFIYFIVPYELRSTIVTTVVVVPLTDVDLFAYTGISIIWSSCRLINPASWGSTRHLTMPSNHSDEIVSSCFRVTYCVIAGYWVGPDIDDDGWGFVEAFVNRTL
ncbi:hypothetical protein ACFE04_028355 [Oxalis oulophora]